MKGQHLYIYTHIAASPLQILTLFCSLILNPFLCSQNFPSHTPQMEETKSKFKRICVYCGSSSGNKASYQEAAVELGEEMVERRIDLVYGGGSVGLMGLVSQAVHDGGRHVLGFVFFLSLNLILCLYFMVFRPT
ncbi:hypothetical protein ACSQ67_015871 [Phaseolus vulgaris]